MIRLRKREPDLGRPVPRTARHPHRRGRTSRCPRSSGAPLTAAIFVLAMITHEGARYAGPAWLAVGLVVFAATRWRERRGMLEDVDPRVAAPGGRLLSPHSRPDEARRHRRGDGRHSDRAREGERGAAIEAITVVQVPRERALDAELPPDVAERAAASLAEARALGEENDVEVHADAVHARSIGHAIVDEAERRGADLIVLGSSPRWRRQSRFFSPTVDHVLQHAPCEVLVVAFPDGVFDE